MSHPTTTIQLVSYPLLLTSLSYKPKQPVYSIQLHSQFNPLSQSFSFFNDAPSYPDFTAIQLLIQLLTQLGQTFPFSFMTKFTHKNRQQLYELSKHSFKPLLVVVVIVTTILQLAAAHICTHQHSLHDPDTIANIETFFTFTGSVCIIICCQ